MRKFLSLAVMCSLAFPAMAFAQPEPPKEVADEMDVYVEEDVVLVEEEEATEPPPKEALMAMPEAPKTAADDTDWRRARRGRVLEGRHFVDGHGERLLPHRRLPR